MKLNPPASSSDLDLARQIARRIHQRRRRADFDRGGTGPALLGPSFLPASARPPWAPAGTPPSPPAVEEHEPPSWDDAEAAEPTADEHLAAALDDLTGEGDGTPNGGSQPPEPDMPSFGDDEPATEAAPALADVVVEDGVSPDEMVGSGGGGDIDEPLAGSAFDEGPQAAEPAAALGPTEDLFEEPPPPPSWDDVVESCREMSGASGAMIIDPAGQVFAARGEWPEPGPDAIAGRLVAMMERTLRDAPTRSVSAPVGGQHLTAWRVPLAEGLVTAAFIADKPLRSDMRAGIDAEIRRGAGA
jgi:pyruvate/2-oxoglutarate dehydrogenase complex dihydrolipoamide acyltransferase (E2) component